jgi:uncharacterized protein
VSQPAFIDVQRRFAAHLRDPARHPAPADVEDRRMAIYRDLFWRNIEGFLSSGFPVLRSLLSEAQWHALVRGFFADHQCHSGYFVDIPGQFLEWLNQHQQAGEGWLPFMAELAWYEWLELALEINTDEIPANGIDAAGDLLAGEPVLNPLLALVGSHWPLHRITAEHIPASPLAEPVWLLVWRNRADRVQFMELNAASARLIQLLEQGTPASGDALLVSLAAELGQTSEALRPFFTDLLEQWRQRDIVLGTRA